MPIKSAARTEDGTYAADVLVIDIGYRTLVIDGDDMDRLLSEPMAGRVAISPRPLRVVTPKGGARK